MFLNNNIFIKNLKTKNFKSFFGWVNFGPFHPKLNAIVGPNGSGKSNFLEALLFTFGKKAINLRSKKLGYLINNLNLKNSSFSSSSIFLCFQRQSYFSPNGLVKEVSVTRKIFRTRKSKYYLNGRSTKFFFLKKLFFFLNVPYGKDLIGIRQGEINDILNMEPVGKSKKQVGLIEYFDENVGSTCYFYFILTRLEAADNFYYMKKFIYYFEIKRWIKKEMLVTQEKTSNKINFLAAKSLKKMYTGIIILLKAYNDLFSKILRTKKATFYTKFVIFLFKRITNFITLNLYFLEFEIKNFMQNNSIFSGNKIEKNLSNLLIRIYKPLKFLKKSIKFDFKFRENYQNILAFFQLRSLSFVKEIYSKNVFKSFFKFKFFKKVLLYIILSSPRKFSKFSPKIYRQNFSLFFDDFIQFNCIRGFLIIFENYSKKKYLYNKKKNNFDISQNLQLLKFSYRSFLSTKLNLEKISLNYSIYKQVRQFNEYREVKKKLIVGENRKLFIIREKFSKSIFPNYFLGFTVNLRSLVTKTIFSYETKALIFKIRKITFAVIKYFRNNFFSRIKLKTKSELTNYTKIKSFSRQQTYVKNRVFILNNWFKVSPFSWDQFEKVEAPEKIHRIKIDYLRLKDSVKISNINLNFQSQTNTRKNRKNNSIFCLTTLQLNFRWVKKFWFFLRAKLIKKKIYDNSKNYLMKKSLFEKIYIILETKVKIYWHLIKRLVKKKVYKKKLLTNGEFFFELNNKIFHILTSNLNFSNFRKNLNSKILGFEKTKNFSILKLYSFHCLIFKNPPSSDLILNKIKSYRKNYRWNSNLFLNSIKNSNDKLLILEKTLVSKKFKTKQILIQICFENFKNFTIASVFLTESVLLKNSSNLMLIKFPLNMYLKKKRSLFILEKKESKVKCLCGIYKSRIEFLKIQIILKSYFKSRFIFNKIEIGQRIKNYGFYQTKQIFFHRLIFDFNMMKNNSNKKKFLIYFFLSKNFFNTFYSERLLGWFLRKIYLEKQKGQFKMRILNNNINLLNCKSVHLIKNLDCHICLEILNKTIRQQFLFFFGAGFMMLNSMDNEDFFSKGLTVFICHKKIKRQNLFQLSGGEKTLSSFSLISSFQSIFPYKWYLLDEIDAALDFKNVTKLSFQLKYRVKNSQIFVITLRNNMILTVNHIFGIYRSKKTSSIMSLRM